MAPSNPKTIELNLKPASYFPTNEYGPFSDEAYELKINPNKIEINGASYNGVINGIHTLTSLQAWGKVSRQTIKDGPRFSERALKLDIASNFYKPSEIKRIIDLMAYYKLNRLYLQIWNNHGLRLDIGFGVAEVCYKLMFINRIIQTLKIVNPTDIHSITLFGALNIHNKCKWGAI